MTIFETIAETIGSIFGSATASFVDTTGIESTLLSIGLLFAGIISFRFIPGKLLKIIIGFGLMGLAYFVYIGG